MNAPSRGCGLSDLPIPEPCEPCVVWRTASRVITELATVVRETQRQSALSEPGWRWCDYEVDRPWIFVRWKFWNERDWVGPRWPW